MRLDFALTASTDRTTFSATQLIVGAHKDMIASPVLPNWGETLSRSEVILYCPSERSLAKEICSARAPQTG